MTVHAQESTLRYILIGCCLLAILFTWPVMQNETRTSRARNLLSDLASTNTVAQYKILDAMEIALIPPGPTSELFDLAVQLYLLKQPLGLSTSENLTLHALERSPARAESWARLAYIELLRDGRVNEKKLPILTAHLWLNQRVTSNLCYGGWNLYSPIGNNYPTHFRSPPCGHCA